MPEFSRHHKPAKRPLLNLPSLWKKPTPRRVLVIGGAGYIGSGLLVKLLKRGHKVRVLDLLFYGKEPIQSVLNHPNLEIVQADFRRVDELVSCMRGVDAVIHLGAIVGDPACALNSDLTIEVNLMATRTIAEVAKGYGIPRFIFASTCSVYGANENDELLTEGSPLNPVSPRPIRSSSCETSVDTSSCASENVFIRNTSSVSFTGTWRLNIEGCMGLPSSGHTSPLFGV